MIQLPFKRNIRIYGDSFAGPSIKLSSIKSNCWGDILQDRIYSHVINKGIGGSSTEYSMRCLMKDIQAKHIGPTDIIIFVTSSPGRLSFKHQMTHAPHTGSIYFHEPTKHNRETFGSWYFENKSFIEWYLLQRDMDLMALNHECYLNMIKELARVYPETLFFVLPAFSHDYFVPPSTKGPANYFQSPIFLSQISKNEYKYGEFSDWVISTGGRDIRRNHLSENNLNILVDLIIESIETRSVENFTYNKFIQKIFEPIRCDQQLAWYIEQNYLLNCRNEPWFQKVVADIPDWYTKTWNPPIFKSRGRRNQGM